MLKTKSIGILLLIAILFVAGFSKAQISSIEVADLTFKVKGGGEKVLNYGFAKGDVLIFSFEERKGKRLQEVEIIGKNGSSIFMDFKIKKISEKRININVTGIYEFHFKNSNPIGRICKIIIHRVPVDSNTIKFNHSVYWRTIYDTSYYTVREKYLLSIDTAIIEVTNKVVKVHSAINVNGSRTSTNFTLPPRTRYWSYYIGVNQEGQEAYKRAAKELANNIAPSLAKIPGYGPLAAVALGGVSYIQQIQKGEDIDYYLVDNSNVNLCMSGDAHRYYSKGKVINDKSRMTSPLFGTLHFCFSNDNAVTGVTVLVKVVAITITKNWGYRNVKKMKVRSSAIPYLSN